jgi:hypothetical protein
MIYAKTSPKKKKTGGHVPSSLKHSNVDPGNHEIVVMEIVELSWSKKELIVGESIDANVETSGFKDGTSVVIHIYETDSDKSPVLRATAKKTLSGNKASLTWKYPENIVPANSGSSRYSDAGLYFSVTMHGCTEISGKIPIYSDLNIKIEKEDGTPIPKVEAIISLSTGMLRQEVSDSSGKISIKKVPPRNHKIKFVDSGRIAPQGMSVVKLDGPPLDFNIVALGSKVHVFKLIELYMYCSHKIEWEGKVHAHESIEQMRRSVCNTNVFEVVPDNSGKDAYKDEVVILSRTATALTCNGAALQKKEDEFGMHAFELKCDQDFNTLVPNIFASEFWKGLVKPNEYKIFGLSTPLTIKCYRPDLFKLQLKFPAMRKWSGGSKLKESTSDVINDLKSKRVPKFIAERKPTKKEGWHLNKWPKPMSSEAPVIFQRNGDDIKLSFITAVGAVIELGNKISSIIQAVQENVPKVGWYFEFENQLFQGTFVVEWGWKEYKDNRAYYYVGANVDIKLIEIKLEIGVGVSGFSCKLQLFGSLTGGVTISAKLSRYSPDGEAEIGIPFGVEIVGAIGARAQAGYFIKLEGTLETVLKLEDGAFKFKQHEGWSIGCSLKWSGITGKLKVSGGTAKKEGLEEHTSESKKSEKEMDDKFNKSLADHEFIGSKDLGRWVWPNPHAKYTPPVIPREDLHKLLEKKLTEGDNIRIKVGSGLMGFNRYMPIYEVAKKIEDKIMSRNDIKKDPKSIEALVIDIRNRLEDVIHEINSGVHYANMDENRFNLFLNGGELKRRLDSNIDPLQDIINRYE